MPGYYLNNLLKLIACVRQNKYKESKEELIHPKMKKYIFKKVKIKKDGPDKENKETVNRKCNKFPKSVRCRSQFAV